MSCLIDLFLIFYDNYYRTNYNFKIKPYLLILLFNSYIKIGNLFYSGHLIYAVY